MSLHVLPLCVWVLSGFLPQSKLHTEVHFKIANVKKLKKNLESTSDLMKKTHAGCLYCYGLGDVLGTKGCQINWWKWIILQRAELKSKMKNDATG